METSTRLSSSARAGLAAIVVLGVAVTAGAAVTSSPLPSDLPMAVLLAPLLAVVLVWLPFNLPRSTGGIVVSFEPGVLVFLLLTLPHHSALLVWLVGVVLGQLTYPGRRVARNRLFNIGLAPIAGGAAVAVADLLQGPDSTGAARPVDLVVLALGLLAYFAIDLGLSALQVSLELGTPWLPEVRQAFVGLSLLILLGVGSVAYLAVLVYRVLPGWALVLVVAPVLTQLYIGRVLVRSNRKHWRSSRLYEAARELAELDEHERLDDTVLRVARTLMDHGVPALVDRAPAPGELGAQLTLGGGTRHLVVRADHRPDSAEEDRRALQGLCALAEQAADRLTLADELRHTASHDALTGLANRRVLLHRLTRAMAVHPCSGERGLLLADLDDFKSINDSLGHGTGDEYLVEVGRRIRSAVGPADLVARLGGDEFAVLVLDGAPDALRATADRVLNALVRELTLLDSVLQVGASIGATSWDAEDDVTTVMTHADVALYEAKENGKGAVSVFDPRMLVASVGRLRMLTDLRQDIGSLQVHYQPVVDLVSGRVDGCEALVRWTTRDGVSVPPSVFVPLAEESGLVVQLGRRVLQQVLLDLPAVHAAAGRPVSVAVNISPRQLRDPQLVDLVRQGVRAAGGAAFLLEMTERVLIEDDEETLAAVHRLAATGAHLFLDDFGSGYSAIGYLRHLPIDGVKLDRSVVAGVDASSRRRNLVSGLVALCGSMGITTIAEGVETEAEWAAVVELGCTLGQGHVFARAAALPEFLELLRTRGSDLAVRTRALPLAAPR